jgi:hypothetical protein
MSDKEFFEAEGLGKFTFRDLLAEKIIILDRLDGDGPLTSRIRAAVDIIPEFFRRYYLHKDSIALIKWAVLLWTVIIFIIQMIKPASSTEKKEAEEIVKDESTQDAGQVVDETDSKESDGQVELAAVSPKVNGQSKK